MKRISALLTGMVLLSSVTACSGEAVVKKTYDDAMKIYYEMSDGTWKCDDHSYKYRLEISGRLHAAVKDTTFVYLSNKESISFEQAWKAAGLSSYSGDYFSLDEAVLVELKSVDQEG